MLRIFKKENVNLCTSLCDNVDNLCTLIVVLHTSIYMISMRHEVTVLYKFYIVAIYLLTTPLSECGEEHIDTLVVSMVRDENGLVLDGWSHAM